jgi:hypothetical protein
MVRPSVGADPYRVSALIVGAVNQKIMNARRSHFSERDFRRYSSSGSCGYIGIRDGTLGAPRRPGAPPTGTVSQQGDKTENPPGMGNT